MIRHAIVPILVALALGGTAAAQSLWNPAFAAAPIFSDTTARSVGDILTIVVSEIQTVENTELTRLEKESNLSTMLTNFDILPNFLEPLPAVEGSSDRNFDSRARYDKDNTLRTTISVVVVDVMPNRNLLVEGIRKIIVDGETKTVRLTGQVRPYDIAADNTVESTRVANAAIAYEGMGHLSRTSNRGWFSHLLDIVWPF